MKFKFTNKSVATNVNLDDFLKSVYNPHTLILNFSTALHSPRKIILPKYFTSVNSEISLEEQLQQCAGQIRKICDCLEKTLNKYNNKSIKQFASYVKTLKENIGTQIISYGYYDRKNQTNIEIMCNQGKKYLEEICFQVKHSDIPETKLLVILDDFLKSEQINECMGGILKILQDTCASFSNDLPGQIQLACVNAVYADARDFIDKNRLLYLYHDGQRDQSVNSAAIGNEVHFVAALRNELATIYPFLDRVNDQQTALFPKQNGWVNKFIELYSNNKFVNSFIETFIESLSYSNFYNLVDYTQLTMDLDFLGSDPDFSLYDMEDLNYPLYLNHKQILSSSIIKRLLNYKYIQLEDDDFIIHNTINNYAYHIYIVGSVNLFWLEQHSDEGGIEYMQISNQNIVARYGDILNDIPIYQNIWNRILHCAATFDNTPLLELALTKIKDLNCTDEFGNTASSIAIINHAYHSLRIILDDGRANLINAHNQCKSALITAIGMNSETAIDMLLPYTTDYYIKDRMDNNLLMLAVIHDQLHLFNHLVKNNIDYATTFNYQNDTALTLCAKHNQYGYIHELISVFKQDINHVNSDKESALVIALRLKHCMVVAELLNFDGHDLNIVSKHGESIQTLATRIGVRKIIHRLCPDIQQAENIHTSEPLNHQRKNKHYCSVQ